MSFSKCSAVWTFTIPIAIHSGLVWTGLNAKRKNVDTLDTAINAFIAKSKEGPDYVCVSCHR